MKFATLGYLAVALVVAIGAPRAGLAAHPEMLFDDPASPVAGNPDGDVTLVEFFDYRCVFCKGANKAVTAALQQDPRLRVVFKELPVLGPGSVAAARAALAAHRQDPDKYVAFHGALMGVRGRLTKPTIMRIARATGFDVKRLEADMSAPEIDQAIKRNLALAATLGIRGTPVFVIGDKIVPGAVNLKTMKRLIALARAKRLIALAHAN